MSNGNKKKVSVKIPPKNGNGKQPKPTNGKSDPYLQKYASELKKMTKDL